MILFLLLIALLMNNLQLLMYPVLRLHLLGSLIMQILLLKKVLPPHFTYQQSKRFFYDLRHYFRDDPFLYKKSVDGIIRRYIPEHEQQLFQIT